MRRTDGGCRAGSRFRGTKVMRIVGLCFATMAIIVVVTILAPTHTPEASSPEPTAEPGIITDSCVASGATALRAQGDVTDDGGDWITRRGLQYSTGAGHDIPDIVCLANAGFEWGDPPEGWELSHGGGATWERSAEHVRIGDYSVKLSVTTNFGLVAQEVSDHEEYRGKVVTFGAWVYHPTVDDGVYLHVFDGVTPTTAFSSTATAWEWVTVTVAVDPNATRLSVRLRVSETRAPNTAGWFDGVIMTEGHEALAVFDDGEFGTGAYSLAIAGLTPDTPYQVRAFAQNEAGIGYGNIVSCETAAES